MLDLPGSEVREAVMKAAGAETVFKSAVFGEAEAVGLSFVAGALEERSSSQGLTTNVTKVVIMILIITSEAGIMIFHLRSFAFCFLPYSTSPEIRLSASSEITARTLTSPA